MQKILIVEDDEKLRNELEIFLNKNGYKAESIKKFDNTLQDILAINPDLLLLDINLPNADGEYICKEIRKKSTGIGLYLCKKLCDKLGMGIELNSIERKETEIRLVFPKSSFIEMK